ncbi:16S rRNA (adenine(1518)-N(6)/adenine(1519)-N(6))-dimethyltransferase RsmA [Candidatus Nitrosacidococcus tergens]|uniref:Ribosomal RNA small subunit methyltransferase A n=1 Tax=Candidatus Nitrosacidococcus tergens TaxID=553981 RepID=A0A7G1QA10_9GAMM|nr:16S rRNA (adenine(1518)-N(6)/adenine(1519)-N(6))-dimethyltransferase RsmA [Candidatus Nitrosacidococcus tergens]CAB1276204.1 S-adenosylmethionine-6-N',N'-adenosyl (rRNA) dimethyltransferase [Candidatus Nitrosacidococcus tergens]
MQPKKRFGQHFLHDPYIISQIIEAIQPQPNDTIVEIGPGQGALTFPLLRKIPQLHAIELDRDLASHLTQACSSDSTKGKLILYNQDALRFDFSNLGNQQPLRIVGNLPYNISTALLFHLFTQADSIKDYHFMLQREIVLRMGATPNSKDYGRLSVMTQFYCTVIRLFTVKPGAFLPPPKVDSMVVRLIPRKIPLASNFFHKVLNQIVTQAFSQRRKTLANSLKGWISAEELKELNIDSRLRPEALSLTEYLTLAHYWQKKTTDL